MGDDMERGQRFADELYALVHRLAPRDWGFEQREDMASHLVQTAVLWVIQHTQKALQ